MTGPGGIHTRVADRAIAAGIMVTPAAVADIARWLAEDDAKAEASICPHCGYDLQKDAPVEYGRLSYDPRIGVSLDGARLAMAPQCHDILGTLMREPRVIITKPAIEDRMGWDCAQSNLLDVHLSRLRKSLERAGLQGLVRTVIGRGVYFDPTPLLGPPAAGRTSGSHLGASATTSARPFLHSDHRVASKEVV